MAKVTEKQLIQRLVALTRRGELDWWTGDNEVWSADLGCPPDDWELRLNITGMTLALHGPRSAAGPDRWASLPQAGVIIGQFLGSLVKAVMARYEMMCRPWPRAGDGPSGDAIDMVALAADNCGVTPPRKEE